MVENVTKTTDIQYEARHWLAMMQTITDMTLPGFQGERLVEFFSELLGAITNCISDTDPVVRERAGEANKDLLELVQVIHVPGESSRCMVECVSSL